VIYQASMGLELN